jgi:hypothetical protein
MLIIFWTTRVDDGTGSKNGFVQTALEGTLAVALEISGADAFLTSFGQGLEIFVLAANDFYSQRASVRTTTCRNFSHSNASFITARSPKPPCDSGLPGIHPSIPTAGLSHLQGPQNRTRFFSLAHHIARLCTPPSLWRHPTQRSFIGRNFRRGQGTCPRCRAVCALSRPGQGRKRVRCLISRIWEPGVQEVRARRYCRDHAGKGTFSSFHNRTVLIGQRPVKRSYLARYTFSFQQSVES